jgi:hypothetical protein
MLASNPPRNSRPELIGDDGQGHDPLATFHSLIGARGTRGGVPDQVYQQ